MHIAGAALAALLGTGSASAAPIELDLRLAFASADSRSPVRRAAAAGDSLYFRTDNLLEGRLRYYYPGPMVQAAAGMKVLPYLTVGLMGGARMSWLESDFDHATPVSPERSAWELGPYARLHSPGAGTVDPYVSVAVEYMRDTQTYLRTVEPDGFSPPSPSEWTVTHQGVGVPLTAGVAFRIGKVFAIGPSVQYAPVFPFAGCVTVDIMGGDQERSCSTDDDPRPITVLRYGVLSMGVTLQFTIPTGSTPEG